MDNIFCNRKNYFTILPIGFNWPEYFKNTVSVLALKDGTKVSNLYFYIDKTRNSDDKSNQFGSNTFLHWCHENFLRPSMSRRGDYWDNAEVGSFFSSLISELIEKRIFKMRKQARTEIFDFTEDFYNRVRRFIRLKKIKPYEFERCQNALLKAFVNLVECNRYDR